MQRAEMSAQQRRSAKWRRAEVAEEPVASSSSVTLEDLSSVSSSPTFTSAFVVPIFAGPATLEAISSSTLAVVTPVYGAPVTIILDSSSTAVDDGSGTAANTGTLTIVLPASSPSSTIAKNGPIQNSASAYAPTVSATVAAPATPTGVSESTNPTTSAVESSSTEADTTAVSPASTTSTGHVFSFTLLPPGYPPLHSLQSGSGLLSTTSADSGSGFSFSPTTTGTFSIVSHGPQPSRSSSNIAGADSDPTNTVTFSVEFPGFTGTDGVVTPTASSPSFSTGSSLSRSFAHNKREIAGAAVGAILALLLGTILAVLVYRRRQRNEKGVSKAWISSPLLQNTADYPDDAYSPLAKRRPRRESVSGLNGGGPGMVQVEPRRLSEGFLGRPVSFHLRDAEMATAPAGGDPNSHLDVDTWGAAPVLSELQPVQTTDLDIAMAPWLHPSNSNSPTSPIFSPPGLSHLQPHSPAASSDVFPMHQPASPISASSSPALAPTAPLRISAKGFMRRIRGRPSLGRASRGLLTTLAPVPESPTPAMSLVSSPALTPTMSVVPTRAATPDFDPEMQTVDLDLDYAPSDAYTGMVRTSETDRDSVTAWSMSSGSHGNALSRASSMRAPPPPPPVERSAAGPKNFSLPWIHRTKGSVSSSGSIL
ncbi:hypothetical protein C8F01DRAFT_504844 [Mycena amicta]|nr:hypothetical protein C8F01DRAFT_504844 [Mycena amicta]